MKENKSCGAGMAAGNAMHFNPMTLHGESKTVFLVAHFVADEEGLAGLLA
jgi:hypothetical protein